MARRHLQRLLTACVLLVLLAGAPPAAAGQPSPVPASGSQLAPAAIDDGDDVRLVDDVVRAESTDRDGIPTAAFSPTASAPVTQGTGSADHVYDSRYGRFAGADAAPRAPPLGS